MKKSPSILSRLTRAVVGLVCGGILGMLALYFIMLLVGSDFGLQTVRPGAILGGVIGLLLGLRSSEPWPWVDFKRRC